MERLLPIAERAGALLKARGETIAVGESSSGGLVAAALLAVPGASAYFVGGAVLYTRKAFHRLVNVEEARMRGETPSSEGYALAKARLLRAHLGVTWTLAETGVAGPTGNKYGYAPGHSCVAVTGPLERSRAVETQSTERVANMYAFAGAALELLVECLEQP